MKAMLAQGSLLTYGYFLWLGIFLIEISFLAPISQAFAYTSNVIS